MIVLCQILCLDMFVSGNKDTVCTDIDGKNLQCTFPENINSTKKDFSVYFYPETGGEGR